MPKKIWRKNFEIRQVDYQMPYSAMIGFYTSQSAFLGKAYTQEGIWVTENMDNTATYFLKDELRAVIKAVMQIILTRPGEVDKLHFKTIKINEEYARLAHKIEHLNCSRLTDKQLIDWYQRILKLQWVSHSIALPTTWFLDSDGEDFSRYLLKYIDERIKRLGFKENPAAVFSLLTTPLRDSMARIEEKEMLLIIYKIQKDKIALNIFRNAKVGETKNIFTKLPSKIRQEIERHYRKWRWTPYTYIGPIYEADYYLEMIAVLIRQKINPKKLLADYSKIHKVNRAKQQAFYKKFKIDKNHQRIFRIAQDIVFIKGFRKDCLYYGCYVRDLLLKEVARRLNLSVMQVKYFAPDEVAVALLKKKYSVEELNERMKFSVIYMRQGKNRIFIGQEAKRFLARQKFEKIRIGKIKELTGMCACPGKARGRVKIVNLQEEISKMQDGDIMVAHTTFPALVPAMKKAAAIVTEDGGITCHAAIVSRELKIPCVVGTKIATKILKDGDMVEVDATKGIVRKL